ncbi:MAG: hypothetical protein ABIY55_27440 [Kofleriaceae bacterium]
MPAGGLPAGQNIEGGAQIRVTPHGLGAITQIVKPLLLTPLTTGICLPKGELVGAGLVTYCDTDSQCGAGAIGCLVKPAINDDGFTLGSHPTDPKILRAHIDARLPKTRLPLHIVVGTCDLDVTVDHLVANLDVALAIDNATGKLGVHANPIDLSIPDSGIHLSNGSGIVCGAITGIFNLIKGLLNGTITKAIKDQLSPAIATLIDTLVPETLGIEGMLDVGSLIAGISPGTQSQLEARILPGGYAHMQNGGLSLGVITGLNFDRAPATRGALASEPALCVPPLATPNLGAAPSSLPPTTRSSFRLDAAEEFDGVPSDPAGTDIAIGLSETMLDLAGHHLVTSGALCLGVGTSLVPQLNLGTIGLFVRSLGDLASEAGNDPLLLVTRPQRALDFTIGDNTTASPGLTIGLDHLEVDFYAFVFERYVRAFTLDLTLNVGINVEIDQVDGQPAKLRPQLIGIEPANVKIKVLNSEFVKESPALLETLLPSVFGLITPLLGNLPEITVPDLAGIRIDGLSIHHVTTNQDDFIAIYGSIDPTSVLSPLGLSPGASATAHVASAAVARLVSVTTPPIDQVRSALLHEDGGALPRVTFDVDRFDAAGRELEWTYRLGNGLWRAWRAEAPLVIEDQAFAYQGKYVIGLQSRVKGDYHTTSAVTQVPVIIDSVAPRISVDKAAWNGDRFEIPAFDIVSGRTLQYAFGPPGASAPASAWSTSAPSSTIGLSRDEAAAYAGDSGQLAVFVKDEVGNTARAEVAPFHGQAGGTAGCASCNTRSTPGAGGLLLVLLVGGVVLGRRGRLGRALRHRGVRRAVVSGVLWAGGSLVMSLQPGCSCGGTATGMTPDANASTCETAADCTLPCPLNAQPFCTDHMCSCSTDIVPGRIGPYSDVAIAPDGTIWVSAYAQSHGDLVVAKATGGRIPDTAWEWVDGVPDGPIAIPGAMIRGGIDENGPDVGMYTSIAVGPDGAPMVSYFDRETASLKLAQKINGSWQIHVVDAGTGDGDKAKLVGMYTSLTLRSDDGRPGIAYLAHVMDGQGGHAEVRFASAQIAHPTAATDWQTWVVDTAPLPAVSATTPSTYPLPDGLGLFIDAARMPNQAPVVAYYDRTKGDLKVAKFNVQGGAFSTAQVLDGSNGVDAGWSPSIAIDAQGVVHVAYVGATADDLKYVTDAADAAPEVVDDGYRTVGTTVDGLPKPEFHFVGDDAGLVLPPGGDPLVVYQDATTQELLLADKHADGSWTHESIAGATTPWPGGYGFFAASAVGGGKLALSTFVVNLPSEDYANASWVEVFTRPLATP